jgi:hypothetical protein
MRRASRLAPRSLSLRCFYSRPQATNYLASFAKSFCACRPQGMSGLLCSPSWSLNREIQTRFVLAKLRLGLSERALFRAQEGRALKLRGQAHPARFLVKRSLPIESGMRNSAV